MSTNTEKSCEVVRIASIDKHPNADRLELARFEMASGPTTYVCVIGKGQYKVGDLVGYVGVDCIVPLVGTDSARWEFLTKRLDGAGKEHYRIKAARLRGVFSEGVLMELGDWDRINDNAKLGDELWEAWGVTEYTPPVKGTAFPPGSAFHSNKDPALRGLFPIYEVDSLKKMPFLFQQGEEVYVSEKVHGTNFRCGYLPLGWFGRQRFVYGSHRTVRTDLRPWYARLWDRLRGRARPAGFYGTDVWAEAVRVHQLDRLLKNYPDYVFYFELFGVSETGAVLQKQYEYGGEVSGLMLLDVFDSDTKTWLTWGEKRRVCGELMARSESFERALYFMPTLHEGPWLGLEAHRPMAEGPSLFHGGTIREGFVVHAAHDGRRGKLKGEGFLLLGAE